MTEPGPQGRSPVIVIILHIGGQGNEENVEAQKMMVPPKATPSRNSQKKDKLMKTTRRESSPGIFDSEFPKTCDLRPAAR
jgi:hypothetical protein